LHKNHAMPTTTDLIGTAETSEILGIDRGTLSRWISAGKIIPALRMPGQTGAYLFHRADVETVRDQRTARAAS
jgi:excisionase family DNA binding protein